jgi:primary-amine oxidase
MAKVETPTVEHPLDPLTEEEIRTTTEILKDHDEVDESFGFYSYQPSEPSKEELAEWDGGTVDREVEAVLRDLQGKETYEATVSLSEGAVTSFDHLPEATPHIPGKDVTEAQEAVKRSEEWQEAARKRGVENFDLALVDPWPINSSEFVPDGLEGRRLARGLSWIAESEEDNAYARPIEGVHAFVDLDEMEVVDVVDNGVVDDDSPLAPRGRELQGGPRRHPGRPDASRRRPAERHELGAGRTRGRVAGLEVPRRVDRPRGPRPSRRPIRER